MQRDFIAEAMLKVGLDPGFDQIETDSDVISEAMIEVGLNPGFDQIEVCIVIVIV